jgi:hypothetical protein
MTKAKISDESIRLLRKAIRTKLGVSTAKSKKPARREKVEAEDDTPAPRKQKVERLGFAD